MLQNIKAIVTDIDGTTTSLSFMQEALQPYIESKISEFIFEYEYELSDLLDTVRADECNPDLTTQEVLEVLVRYRKDNERSSALDDLQFKIWQLGYDQGDLVGHVYDDALSSLKLWSDEGLHIYAYSSCSVDAQRLLFQHTHIGDVTEMFSGYFDLSVGAKDEAKSYSSIAEAIGVMPSESMFLSDSVEEADAAAKAGMRVAILDREGMLFDAHGHNVVQDFEKIIKMVSINV